MSETKKISKALSTEQIKNLLSVMADKIETSSERKTKFQDAIGKDIENLKTKVKDGYSNKLLAIGAGEDKVMDYDAYSFNNSTLNMMLWTAMYNNSWEFKKFIDMPSEDQVGAGIQVFFEDEKFAEIIYQQYNEHKQDFIELLKWSALYGGAIQVIIPNGLKLEDLNNPLRDNVSKIITNKNVLYRVYTSDRWFGIQKSQKNVENVNSIDYGTPENFTVHFKNGDTQTIHHDYILIGKNRKAPRLVEDFLDGWGYAEGSHVINTLMRNDKIKASVQSLIDKSLTEIFKMKGVGSLFDDGSPEAMENLDRKMTLISYCRNLNSLTLMDVDDSYEQNSFSGLSGLSDLVSQNMWEVAASEDMAGVLYGQLNNGLSSDQDSLIRYNGAIHKKCNTYFKPILDKWFWIMKKIYGVKERTNYNFGDIMREEMTKLKMESISEFVDLGQKIVETGVITTKQFGKALQNYLENGAIDFKITDETLEEAEQEAPDELENIDI